eukprot:TRINITY_DN103677_c0_g1_i1.p1 TRINITY_DN103677_c0_g1~~TRINITY_DN103677_c0_g1_i1.p1  ORF type:complete len:1181 (-),score=158.84 TRINITY_DN103677_c0_g1_i1:85-3627(-)
MFHNALPLLLLLLLLLLSGVSNSANAATLSGSRVQRQQPELEEDGLGRTSMWASVGAGGVVGDGRQLMRSQRSPDARQVPLEADAAPRQDSVATIAGLSWMGAATTQTAEIHNAKTVNTTGDQDCEWYDWSPWSFCSKTCNHGYHTRKRSIALPRLHNGAECVGEAEEVDYCNSQDCPVDCQWGDWDSWSRCTHSCDGGTHQRGRPIVAHNNSLGKPCSASDGVQTEECGTNPCPHDCQWSVWSVWSFCSASCAGGTKERQRSVSRASSEGGLACEGNASQVESCNARACPRDCVLGDWADWGICSTTCGSGTKARQRAITSPEEGGGAQCTGPLRDEVNCSIGPCRTDCVWGPWSNLSTCSVSCGGSESTVSVSYRAVAVPAAAGGKECEGKTMRSELCGQSACPVDCEWSHWTTWRECSKTCGGGITDRYRNHSIVAMNGGVACEGSGRDVKHCARDPCPTDCRLSEWSDWGDCSSECGAGEVTRFRSEMIPATLGGIQCEGDTTQQKQCLGTDCVTFAWLLKTGAVAVSGAMVGYTDDPISFASNQRIEQATKQFLAELPASNITRVHASMMPSSDLGGGGQPNDVHIWFSMVIPNSSKPDPVIAGLEEYEKDPRSVSILYGRSLASAGIKARVNVTEFTVGKIRKMKTEKYFVTYKNKTNASSNVSKELVDWNNPLRPRVNCASRIVPPAGQDGERFGEGDGTLKAVAQTFAEMVDMNEDSVRSSQVPKRASGVMDKFVAGATLSTEQKQAWDASKDNASVDALSSLLGDKADNEIAAVNQAYDIASTLMREDDQGVTERLNDNLKKVQAKSWTPSRVSFMLCRAVGDVPTWYDGTWRDENDGFFGGASMHLKATPATWSVDQLSAPGAESWIEMSSRSGTPYQLIPTPTQVTLRENRGGTVYDYVFDATRQGKTMQICRGSQCWTLTLQEAGYTKPAGNRIRVTGVFEIQVLKPRMFSSDARTEIACKMLLSKLLDMPIKGVQVSVVPKKAVAEGEYYESLQQQAAHASLLQLGDGTQPKVEELSEAELDSMDDLEPRRANGLEDETTVFCWFVLHFAHNETAAVSAVQKIRNLDLAMTGLKLQNLLMDMRMTMSVTVTSTKADRDITGATNTNNAYDLYASNSTRRGTANLMETEREHEGFASGVTSLGPSKSAVEGLCPGLVILLGVVLYHIA